MSQPPQEHSSEGVTPAAPPAAAIIGYQSSPFSRVPTRLEIRSVMLCFVLYVMTLLYGLYMLGRVALAFLALGRPPASALATVAEFEIALGMAAILCAALAFVYFFCARAIRRGSRAGAVTALVITSLHFLLTLAGVCSIVLVEYLHFGSGGKTVATPLQYFIRAGFGIALIVQVRLIYLLVRILLRNAT